MFEMNNRRSNISIPISQNNRNFAAVRIIEISLEETPIILMDESILPTCSLRFNGKLVSSAKEGIEQISLALQSKPAICDFDRFERTKNAMEIRMSGLEFATSPASLKAQRFQVDAMAMTPSIVGCQRSMKDLLTVSTTAGVSINSTECQHPPNSGEWINDPCCNWVARFQQCCEPQLRSTTVLDYAIDDDALADVCGDSDCISPVLGDYIGALTTEESGLGCSQLTKEVKRNQGRARALPLSKKKKG
jgi:hypothetical protein